MAVPVLDLGGVVEDALVLQVFDDLIVAGADLLAGHHREVLREPSGLVHRAERGDAEPPAGLEVVGTEPGRGVDQPGVVLLDVIGGDDLVGVVGPLQAVPDLEGRDVAGADQVLPLHLAEDLEGGVASLLHDELCLALHYDDGLGPAVLRFHEDPGVGLVRVDGHGHVGGQGPGGGGPDEERRPAPVGQGEPDHHGGVGLVPVVYLGLGEGGLAAGAPGDDPGRVLQQPFFERLLGGPPGGLHVVELQGLIGVVPVHPDAQPLERVGHAGMQPVGEVLAGRDELVYADLVGDLLLGVDPDLLLDLDLDGEAVHVEPGLVADIVAVHPPVADEDVLDRLVHRRPEMDRSRRVRGAVEEVERRSVLPQFLGLLVCMLRRPELLDVLLRLGGGITGLDLLYHRSSF